MLDFADFFAATPELEPWHDALRRALDERYREVRHGDEPRWSAAIDALPATVGPMTLDAPTVATGPCDAGVEALMQLFAELKPWRKGPFRFGSLTIDSEWRSDRKWARLTPHLTPLAGRRVIDIGCGNGYYLLRCLGAGGRLAIGVDPTRLFLWQFEAFRRQLRDTRAHVLPLTGEDMPPTGCFDTAFTMGVIYHRREPVQHLREVGAQLRSGGELVVESLVIDQPGDTALVPEERYARMRNVWEVPTPSRLARQVEAAGFTDARVVDVTPTTVEEQRATPFMTFESLRECLDPGDPSLTIEGHPAPLRAIVIAQKP
tara:strand:- start:797 stop:1747 length:951 start_codon:yes stop_codon:yes gene_type:complete